ncbi:MAG TPA: DUF2330 domain-containing protein [candidate division WOR-3 bacterium]|uniref:DUF2330 domain-containing protein n=1 Tax=candidate division WOR-3 bacterium TaxID=2052148 RepID=A0A9C9K0Q6_UNCW3|nr:DUF2330 domain-containing protein [candidate division WOR-3 bacterium]
MRKIILVVTSVYTLGFLSPGYSDRGLLPLNPNVQIFEPNQRAMIAWNGEEEILLLSTDLHASDSTILLEVLPLPAEPAVKKGDIKTFQKATALINSKLASSAGLSKRNGEGAKEAVPGGEVTFHKKIGAHDISVTRLINGAKFVDWVAKYLKSLGVEKNIISAEMQELIEEYIADGFIWFVFDLVSLTEEFVTNEPIQYQFKSESLFYPLKITKTGEGYTLIDLLILTPRLLRNFPDLPIHRVHLKHDPITISNIELKELNEDMYNLLGRLKEMKLRIWQVEGSLSSFDEDLIAY